MRRPDLCPPLDIGSTSVPLSSLAATSRDPQDLHPFPTRRSSDLRLGSAKARSQLATRSRPSRMAATCEPAPSEKLDRKSTRLNSSHLVISYAVFCLKKKKIAAHA